MAFAPQQYNNNNNNDNNNNNNNMRHNIHENLNQNTPRRVQFSMHGNANSSSSNKSLPTPNPLIQQESMPYQPELDEYNNYNSNRNTPPHLSKNVKSIEISSKLHKVTINSNTSTPESILNEPIPSNGYNVKTGLAMNTSNSILKPTNLMNQESHQIADTPTSVNSINEDNEDGFDNQKILPITQFNNSNHNVYNHKTQQYYRQETISNASYDHLPDLYTDTSIINRNNNNNNNNNNDGQQPPPLPNATSIALTETETETESEMKQQQQERKSNNKYNKKLSLDEHFNNDVEAFETWMACCDIQDDTLGYYSALYPLLCEIFAESTKCSRVPKQCDLEKVILKHGAKKMKISKLNSMNNLSGIIPSDLNKLNKDCNNNRITPPPVSPNDKHLATVSSGSYDNNNGGHHGFSDTISFDFDNPSSIPKYLVTIKYKSFFKFWKWFKECCNIIRELSHLWDINEQSILQCNLFCGREECQTILDQAPQGTFMLRLSSVIKGGIVLSYVEPSFSKKDKHFKHTILIRRRTNEYELRSHSKSKKNKNKLTSISSLIRSFVKIKFLYTPNNLYPKKSIF